MGRQRGRESQWQLLPLPKSWLFAPRKQVEEKEPFSSEVPNNAPTPIIKRYRSFAVLARPGHARPCELSYAGRCPSAGNGTKAGGPIQPPLMPAELRLLGYRIFVAADKIE